MSERTYSTAEVIALTGFTRRQLDYWSAQGYLPFSDSPGKGNARRFGQQDVDWLLAFREAVASANAILGRFGASLDIRFTGQEQERKAS